MQINCISGHQKLPSSVSIRFEGYINNGYPVTLYPLTPSQLAITQHLLPNKNNTTIVSNISWYPPLFDSANI